MKKFFLASMGCNKNLVDSEIMLASLGRHGFVRVNEPREAEIIIINTCSFIEAAQEESVSAILEAGKLKEQGTCKLLVVTGCLSQMYGRKLFSLLPEINVLVGTADFPRIVTLIEEAGNDRVFSVGQPDYPYSEYAGRELLTPRGSAYLKIAEGCDNRCSYCIIPELRGKYRSRPPEVILEEANALTAEGVMELTLVAQDTSRYGMDRDGVGRLPELLAQIAEVPGVEWLRFLYCHPDRINARLLDSVKKHRNICRYLDVPIQHASSKVLRLMGRRGDSKELSDLFCRVRDKIPEITLRTTVMVGFPGETEKDLVELLSFLERVQFDWVGVFAFCSVENTAAAKLKPTVAEQEKEERASRVREFQERITEKRNSRWLGRIIPVLIEGESEESPELLVGRAECQSPDVDGIVYVRDGCRKAAPGNFAQVRIEHVEKHNLVGEVCCECTE